MSYTGFGSRAVSGETRDPAMEVPSEDIASSTITCVTTAGRFVTGTRGVLFPTGTDASKAVCFACGTPVFNDTNIVVVMGQIGLSGTPSSEVGVLSEAAQGGDRFIRVNTSLQLVLYDGSGNAFGHPSLDTISTSGMTSFMVVYDFTADQSTSQTMAFVTMYVGGKYQWDGFCQSAGALLDSPAKWWGEWLPAATNRGADLYGDDLCMLFSGNTGTPGTPETDAPHIYNIPILKVSGSGELPVTGNSATHTAWGLGTGAFDFEEVDDSTEGGFTHDSDTTYVGTVTNSQKETYTWSAANPLTSADTITMVAQDYVVRTATAGKIGFMPLYRDGSGNEANGTTLTLTTSYLGVFRDMTASRPAGGDWVYTDFDLSGGISTLEIGGETPSSGSIGTRLTSIVGPKIVHYSAVNDMSIGWV